jgi:uncharacterized delta-60 repeat protein
MGADGNLYAAGHSRGITTSYDFTVVSLTDSGAERWVYRYNGPGDGGDEAREIVMGSDGNLYAAGWSNGGWSSTDFTVVSLANSGVERWVYRYNRGTVSQEIATSVAVGTDGSIYAAGRSHATASSHDLTVVGLTDSGVERWVYMYDGPGSGWDMAWSIVMGSDGNLYIAGLSEGSGTSWDFVVVSLTDSGAERWVYRYNGPANGWDEAYSIIMGSDGNLYAAGLSEGHSAYCDFTVVSLTDSGTERWVYLYDGPGSGWDEARSIVMGPDGNLYAAGSSYGSGTHSDFTMASLTDSGTERWIYTYNGTSDTADFANSIAVDLNGNLYAAGQIKEIETSDDLVVVSLTDSGSERWVYQYKSPWGWDEAYSAAVGSDGNVYAAGCIWGSGTSLDFTVVSLSPDVGVEEETSRPLVDGFSLLQNEPNPFRSSTSISYFLTATLDVTLVVYDVSGRQAETLVNETQQPGIHQVRWDRKTNPSGVYFYRLTACPERSPESPEGQSRRAGEFVETRKMVVID